MESHWVNERKRTYTTWSSGMKAIDVTMDFQAGVVYQVKAVVVNGQFVRFVIDPLEDEAFLQKIIEARNTFSD